MPDQQRICGEAGHWNKMHYRQLCQDGGSPNTALYVNNFIGRLLLALTPPAKLRGDAGWTVHVLRRREARPVRSSLRAKFFDNPATSVMAADEIKGEFSVPMHA